MSFYSAEGWLNHWLSNKTGGASESTLVKYRHVVRSFLAHLGSRAGASVASVSPSDIIAFRNKLWQEGRSASTCNNIVKKILNVPFEAARKLGFIPTNPVAAVDSIRERGAKSGREPFTDAEVGRLIDNAQGDWRGAIIWAVTSGLRLGDTIRLQWQSVDLAAGLLRIDTEKTGAVVVLPIHVAFAEWLSQRTRGIGRAPVFPGLATQRLAGADGLSAQFRKLMQQAGVIERVVEREGKGRTGYSKGFHALRHSFISSLANAGVPQDVRQRLAGHVSVAANRIYTHHEDEILRAAVGTITLTRREA